MTIAAASLSDVAPVRADHAPSFVVPGRSDVPVIIKGRDASYAVVEGDWGLYRPGHIALEVYGPTFYPSPYRVGPYFPGTGRRPPYGRREIIPSPYAPLPPPAENFQRFWGAGSEFGPVTAYPPFDPPAVVVAPRRQRSRGPAAVETPSARGD